MSGRVVSYLPAGALHVSWTDRRAREGVVVFVADRFADSRLPAALNDRYFARQIPRWRQRGVALDLHVYPKADG